MTSLSRITWELLHIEVLQNGWVPLGVVKLVNEKECCWLKSGPTMVDPVSLIVKNLVLAITDCTKNVSIMGYIFFFYSRSITCENSFATVTHGFYTKSLTENFTCHEKKMLTSLQTLM